MGDTLKRFQVISVEIDGHNVRRLVYLDTETKREAEAWDYDTCPWQLQPVWSAVTSAVREVSHV